MGEIKEFLNRFRTSGYFVVLELVGFAIALVAIVYTAIGHRLNVEESREGNINIAWQNLTSVAPGNSGKVQAIETLVSAGIALDGIDISCQRMLGIADRVISLNSKVDLDDAPAISYEPTLEPLDFDCSPYTYLRDMNISTEHIGKQASLKGANLSYTDFSRSNLNGADLSGSILTGANLENASLIKTLLNQAQMDEIVGYPDLSEIVYDELNLASSEIGQIDIPFRANTMVDLTDATVNLLIAADTLSPYEIWFEYIPYILLEGADIKRIEGKNANLAFWQINHAVFRSGAFEELSFAYSPESPEPEAGLVRTTLENVNFINVDFGNVDFSGMTLKNVRFKDCDLSQANFDGATFSYVDITGSKFCNETNCSKGLSQEQLDHTLVIYDFSGNDTVLQNTEWVSNSEQKVLNAVFDNPKIGNYCGYTGSLDENELVYSRTDWDGLFLDELSLRCDKQNTR